MAGRTLSRSDPTAASTAGTPTVDATVTSGAGGRSPARARRNALGPTGPSHRPDHAGRRPGRARSQVRGQWLVLAGALTVLAGLLVAWSLDRAAGRVDVVSVARRVPAGTVIQPGDLTTTAIAFDTPVTGLAPAASLDALAGRVATVDLEPGVLLSSGMWADGSELGADERTVGALLDAGTHPGGIAAGTSALAVSVDAGDQAGGSDQAGDAVGTPDVVVRVLDADVDARGALRVTLAVPAADAARIARLAAADGLVLVGIPAVTGAGGSPADGEVESANGTP